MNLRILAAFFLATLATHSTAQQAEHNSAEAEIATNQKVGSSSLKEIMDVLHNVQQDPLQKHQAFWKLYQGTKMVFEFAGESTETFLRPIEQRQGTVDAFDLMLAPCTAFGARLARESLGIPLINVHLQPAVMISAHEIPVLLPGMEHLQKLPLWLRRWLIRLPNPADRFAAPAVARRACGEPRSAPIPLLTSPLRPRRPGSRVPRRCSRTSG